VVDPVVVPRGTLSPRHPITGTGRPQAVAVVVARVNLIAPVGAAVNAPVGLAFDYPVGCQLFPPSLRAVVTREPVAIKPAARSCERLERLLALQIRAPEPVIVPALRR